jgi:glycosyltransferase involved in cell wall biosynthesis
MMPADVSEKVTFHGWVGHRPQLIEHYYQGDIFVLPSICNDSFGIPVVEAMAAGAPVVASRSGGVVETVKDRETGFIVEKNDAPQLAQALLSLLQDDALRKAMGKAGRERALANFTWDKVADTMFRRYQALSGAGSSVPTEPTATPLLEYASANMAS